MNIDVREANTALHRTKRHVETIQEIRHKLQGATRFSEMDVGHGYHQIALAENSRYIGTFQTHEGLHRFKVLFFGASPATELFHDRVKAALAGLPGCTSIHDNILVWDRTPEEHEANLDACLTRLEEKGLTLRREKCTFGATSVSWFGTIFSQSGMSADPKKIQAIKQAGPPKNSGQELPTGLPIQRPLYVQYRSCLCAVNQAIARPDKKAHRIPVDSTVPTSI